MNFGARVIFCDVWHGMNARRAEKRAWRKAAKKPTEMAISMDGLLSGLVVPF
jgi:hypothetical protein